MSIKALQKKIGVVDDGDFGPKTLKAARDYFKLTNEQAANFFGQCAHETGEFKIFTENLNYSYDGLLKVFPKYFDSKKAAKYARQPIAIANLVYANRMGNGDEKSGDGYKFRGRGAIQCTGRSNYLAFSKSIDKSELMDNPDPVSSDYAFESAKWFFDSNKLWTIASKVDDTSITNLTKRINGGKNGLAHRIELTKKFYGWLKK